MTSARLPISREDLHALTRFARLGAGTGFHLAVVEVRSEGERLALTRELRAALADDDVELVEVPLHDLPTTSVWLGLSGQAALRSAPERSVWLLWGLELTQRALTAEHPPLFLQLNAQRDLLAREFPYPWVLLLAPATWRKLRHVAPDFSDFVALDLGLAHPDNAEAPAALRAVAPKPFPWPWSLLATGGETEEGTAAGRIAEAEQAAVLGRTAKAHDALGRLSLLPPAARSPVVEVRSRLVGAWLAGQQGGWDEARALADEALAWLEGQARDPPYGAALLGIAEVHAASGDPRGGRRLLLQESEAGRPGELSPARAWAVVASARLDARLGDLDESGLALEGDLPAIRRLGDPAILVMALADLAWVRSRLGDEAAAAEALQGAGEAVRSLGDARAAEVARIALEDLLRAPPPPDGAAMRPVAAVVPRVFLAGTAEDLRSHRQRVARALLRMGYEVDQAESFGARPRWPVAECEERAAAADALVVCVAHRYGWVPVEEDGGDGRRSISWLEVAAAQGAGKPVLVFLVDLGFEWIAGKEQDDLLAATEPEEMVRVGAAVRGLQRFRAHLEARHVRATFTTPDDLAMKVATSLATTLPLPAAGPGPGDFVTDLRSYLAALEQRTSHLDVRGIGSAAGRGRPAHRYPIESLHAPLRTRRAEAGEGALGLLHGDPVSLASLLPKHPRLLIEGQPGAGKTTFLRLVACMLARDLLGDVPCPAGGTWRAAHLGSSGSEPARHPILVRLGGLVDRLRGGSRTTPRLRHEVLLLDALEGQCAESRIHVCADHWQALLAEGRAVLLLDGLDEVADPEARTRVLELIDDAVKAWPGSPVIVTSRPIDTTPLRGMGFHHAVVEPFGREEIDAFMGMWVATLYGVKSGDPDALPQGAKEYRRELAEAITGRGRIRQLAANPVMLTCLCVVHWNENRLPEGKSRVYQAVVRWLLEARQETRRGQGYTRGFAHKAFARLALAMMDAPGGKRSTWDLVAAARALDEVVAREWSELADDEEERVRRACDWLRYECTGSGIVEEVGNGRVRFWHLTFQEYLAAVQLSWQREDEWWPVVERHLTDAQWRETLDMLPGCLLEGGEGGVDRLLAGVMKRYGDREALADQAKAAGVMGRLLVHSRVYDYKPAAGLEEAYGAALDRALAVFSAEGAAEVPVADRIAAAEALGQGGDPRLVSAKDNLLPVPGQDGVLLGRYPVTVQEYQGFVDDRGYERPELWSDEGWAMKEDKAWEAPESWAEQLGTPSRPVVYVSWYEAEAYCAWLAELTGLPARLPWEAEWEAAATHPAGEYPWGAEEPDAETANFDGDVNAPTPVGVYPGGVGPGGHLDLAGNVLEWCGDDRTADAAEEGRQRAGRRGLGDVWRALRGGGWWLDARGLRSAHRDWYPAGGRYIGLGFRAAVSPASTVRSKARP